MVVDQDSKTADELGKKLKQISVAEFFEKNRHLLGFDSKRKALLTCVKEAVDNSLDACEEMGVLPDIKVKVSNKGEDVYRVVVEDNGPGIVKEKLASAFGSLLFGSKFHVQKQSRGQQGIGISASLLYSQLTTGKPGVFTSRVHHSEPARKIELMIDVAKNSPDIISEINVEEFPDHGTKVEFEMEGEYFGKGQNSITEYLRQTSIINPHAKIIFTGPDGEKVTFSRTMNKMPPQPKEIKPHPHGIELGILQRMMARTKARTLQAFLTGEFSRVGATSAKDILKAAKLETDASPSKMDTNMARNLLKAMQAAPLMKPPLDCLSPIGEEDLAKSIKNEIKAEFITTVSRSPDVYRGIPFQIEVGLAYGGEVNEFRLLRFANKVPLSFNASACVLYEAVKEMDWRRYQLSQSGGEGMPDAPLYVILHFNSVWVPFASEGKQAIASYPEIKKEIKLALQEAGRRLQVYLRRQYKADRDKKRANTFVRYSKELIDPLSYLTNEDRKSVEKTMEAFLKARYGDIVGGED